MLTTESEWDLNPEQCVGNVNRTLHDQPAFLKLNTHTRKHILAGTEKHRRQTNLFQQRI